MALRGLRGLFFSLTKYNSVGLRSFQVSSNVIASSPSTEKSTPVHESIQRAESLSKKYEQHVEEAVSRWAKNDEIYYGKERDTVRFPTIKYPEQHPKVRLGFLPDSWFQVFYPKTGVTGPYLLLFGSTTYLISKEIWVVDAHFVEFGVFLGMVTYLTKKLAPYCTKFLDKLVEDQEENRYHKPLRLLNQSLDNTIKTAEEEISRASAVPILIQAKEENVNLQLEAAYRERLQQVYRAVHRRLDYHVERENTRRRFQQQHTIKWVVDNVIKGITPAQEKETLAHCIGELKRLGQIHKASTASV